MSLNEGAARADKATEQQLTHPLSNLLTFPPDIERQLSVVWALGKNENIAAIKKRDYETLDVLFLEELLEELFCNDHPVYASNCFDEQIGVLKTQSKMNLCETYIKGLLQQEKFLVKDSKKRNRPNIPKTVSDPSEAQFADDEPRDDFFSADSIFALDEHKLNNLVREAEDPVNPVPEVAVVRPEPLPRPAPIPNTPDPAPAPDPAPSPAPDPAPDPAPSPAPDPAPDSIQDPTPALENIPQAPDNTLDPAPVPPPPSPVSSDPSIKRNRPAKKISKKLVTDAEIAKNRKENLQEHKNARYEIRNLRRRRRRQAKLRNKQEAELRRTLSVAVQPDEIELPDDFFAHFELLGLDDRDLVRVDQIDLIRQGGNTTNVHLLKKKTLTPAPQNNTDPAPTPNNTPPHSPSLIDQRLLPIPQPHPPQSPTPEPNPDSPPPRAPSPAPMQIGRDYTPLQKQSILFTLAKFRKLLDKLDLKQRPILFSDLAPVQSTSKREASVLAAQLFELEKMRYLTVEHNPATSSSVDPTNCSTMEIILSDDFDFTVPEPKFF